MVKAVSDFDCDQAFSVNSSFNISCSVISFRRGQYRYYFGDTSHIFGELLSNSHMLSSNFKFKMFASIFFIFCLLSLLLKINTTHKNIAFRLAFLPLYVLHEVENKLIPLQTLGNLPLSKITFKKLFKIHLYFGHLSAFFFFLLNYKIGLHWTGHQTKAV